MLVNQKNLKPPTNYTGSKDKLMTISEIEDLLKRGGFIK